MIKKPSSRRVRGLLALLATPLLGLALAGPASAAADPPATPTVVSWTDTAGHVNSARALTASEIKARGLDKYIDMSRQAATTPQIHAAGAVKAVKKPTGGVSPAASGCWSTWFGYSMTSALWGKTDVTWCGDGTWVTYSTSNCYGGSSWPTYQYMGCSNYPNYGAGWNLYQVKTQWGLCDSWVPLWGSCVHENFPWEQYQFLGNGQILWNGGS
jgi:hypothetical protein